MFDEPFRARFSPVLRPLVPPLARSGITPTHVTVATFVLGIAAAMCIANGLTIVGLATWLTSRVGDALDGLLARETNQSTAFGGYLDITLDMAAYAAMAIGFAVLHPAFGVAWAMVLAGYVLVITTTLALSDAAGTLGRQVSATDRTFQFTPGFAEAGETNTMYVIWVLFPAHMGWLVWAWIAVLFATAIQRTYRAWRVLR
jgi:phosphatidylglycerophosphate synthase